MLEQSEQVRRVPGDGVGSVGQSQGVQTLTNLRKEWVVSTSKSH